MTGRRYVEVGTTDFSPLLRTLPRDRLVTTLERSRGVTGRSGDRLASDRDNVVLVIVEGVAAARVRVEGADHVVEALHGRGGTIGLTPALGHVPVAGDLIAIGAVTALAVPADIVSELIDRLPNVARACLDIVVAEQARLSIDQAHLASATSGARVERRLLELAARFGRPDGHRVVLDVPITQQVLASWAHTSRESTVKALHSLRRAGVISTGRKHLVIEDIDGLRARRAGLDPTVAALLRTVD